MGQKELPVESFFLGTLANLDDGSSKLASSAGSLCEACQIAYCGSGKM